MFGRGQFGYIESIQVDVMVSTLTKRLSAIEAAVKSENPSHLWNRRPAYDASNELPYTSPRSAKITPV